MSNKVLLKDWKKSKTFCILPWTHLASWPDGTALLCCVAKGTSGINLNDVTVKEAINSPHFKQARVAMLNGEQYHACQPCYDEEKSGITSHRLRENDNWNHKIGEETIDKLVKNTLKNGKIKNDLYYVDFRLGNTCNLSCIMCRPVDSSKWIKESKILSEELKTDAKWDWKGKSYIEREKYEWYKRPEFLESFYESCSNMKMMIFAGGEPLLIAEHKLIIKELVSRGYAKNIQVNYHTNGTIYDSELMELWKNFKRVEIYFSIDGVERINRYLRYPSLHDLVMKNFKKYDDNASDNMYFQLLYTVQAFNIYYIPEFYEWMLSQNFKKINLIPQDLVDGDNTIILGSLHWPQYLSTKILPENIKRKVTEKLTKYVEDNKEKIKGQNVYGSLELMNSEDWSHLLSQTKEYIEKLDEMRDLNYKESFKELVELGLFDGN
jgi:molybdenum cofactor biosynthesis enzyme MoaA